jgi:hypothetical protein
MSSLYDKYYSDINKNYIYELSCNIIKKKYNTDISQDKYFKDIYIKNIDETFKNTDTEDIVVLNRKLLQLQITSYKSYNNNANNVNPIILNGANRIIEDTDSIYDFKIITPEGEYILESLMISQENNILFGNPVIIVNINSLDMYLKLSSSYNLNSRTFLEYVPINKQKISFKKISDIIIKNSLNITTQKNESTNILKIYEDYIEVSNNNYKVGDSLKINNQILTVKNIHDNKDVYLENINVNELSVGEKILNISESPILIFKNTN